MSEHAIARRYASALYEEARDTGSGVVERVDADVDLLLETVRDSRELRLFLSSPVVSVEKKESILKRLFEPKVSGITLSFLLLVTRKGREPLIPAMLASYRQLRFEQQGIVEARARVASAMSNTEIDELRASLAKMIGSEIELEVEEDADLIGGIIVRIGDRVYDGSLRRQLAVLRRQLQGGVMHTN